MLFDSNYSLQFYAFARLILYYMEDRCVVRLKDRFHKTISYMEFSITHFGRDDVMNGIDLFNTSRPLCVSLSLSVSLCVSAPVRVRWYTSALTRHWLQYITQRRGSLQMQLNCLIPDEPDTTKT